MTRDETEKRVALPPIDIERPFVFTLGTGAGPLFFDKERMRCEGLAAFSPWGDWHPHLFPRSLVWPESDDSGKGAETAREIWSWLEALPPPGEFFSLHGLQERVGSLVLGELVLALEGRRLDALGKRLEEHYRYLVDACVAYDCVSDADTKKSPDESIARIVRLGAAARQLVLVLRGIDDVLREPSGGANMSESANQTDPA